MTANGKRVTKYARVAAAVRAQIADGTLRPGQPAPSGAALSRATGYSTLTCRRALRVLVAEGVLVPGPSRNARPRVAGPPQQQAERDLAAATRALSRGLAARRRDRGLTQPGLAALLDVSVTTIGHAETGRLWQSRQFWQHVDAALGAGGELLRLHEAYGEASASGAGDPPDDDGPAPGTAGPAGAAADQPPGPGADAAGAATVTWPYEAARAAGPGACLGGGARDVSAGGGGPAGVVIMWGDGSVTTVHPPGTPAPETDPAGAPPSGEASPGAGRPY